MYKNIQIKHLFLSLIFSVIAGCMPYEEYFEEAQRSPATIIEKTGNEQNFESIVKQRCTTCHYYHQPWKNYTLADFVASGQVIPGNFEDSPVIKRLVNFGGDMPKDTMKALSKEEVAILKKEILSLVPTDIDISLDKNNLLPGESFNLVIILSKDLRDENSIDFSAFKGGVEHRDFEIGSKLPMNIYKKGKYIVPIYAKSQFINSDKDISFSIKLKNYKLINLNKSHFNFRIISNSQPKLGAPSDTYLTTEGETLKIPLSLNIAQKDPVSVKVNTSNLKGIKQQDISFESNEIIFNPGETNKNISIQIIDDKLYAGDSSFTILLESEELELYNENIMISIDEREELPVFSTTYNQYFISEGESFNSVIIKTSTPFKSSQNITLKINSEMTELTPSQYSLELDYVFPANTDQIQLNGSFAQNDLADGNQNLSISLSSAYKFYYDKPISIVKLDDEADLKTATKNKALSILQFKCISCHSGRHDKFKDYKSDIDWISNNFIKPKKPDSSLLLQRTRSYGGNMPPDARNKLTGNDLSILKDWINNMDDSDKPVISFRNSQVDILENENQDIVIESNKVLQTPLVINLSVKSKNATNDDYSIQSMQVTMNANQNSASFNFTVNDDSEVDSSEYVELELSVNENDAFLGSQKTTKVNLIDSNDDVILNDSNIKPRLGNKFYIGSVFKNVFSHAGVEGKVNQIITDYIYKNPEIFGPKCDPYEDPYKDSPEANTIQCQGGRSYRVPDRDGKERNTFISTKEYADSNYNLVEKSSIPTFSLVMESCERFIADEAIYNAFMSQHGLNENNNISSADIQKIYSLFNPGKTLSGNNLSQLNTLFSSTNWKPLIIATCSDPAWLVP